MIEIKVLTDENKKAELLKSVGKQQGDIMAAFDRGEIIAFTVFTLTDRSMTVEHIIPQEDIMLADGMLRSTIHVAMSRGLAEVFYADTVSEKLLTTLKFIKDSEKKLLDHDKLFAPCCGGK